MTAISFRVLGVAIPQGSKTPIRNKAKQVVGMRESSAKKLAPWRETVTKAARTVAETSGHGPLDGPLRLDLRFRLPRASGYRKGEIWHRKKPDVSKLVRAIEDSLTVAGLIRDDALIAALTVEKRLADHVDPWLGVEIHVSTLTQITGPLEERLPLVLGSFGGTYS